jgi:hypothetical protein
MSSPNQAPKKSLPSHYVVTVAGTYYVKQGDGHKTKKPYEVTLKVPYEFEGPVPVYQKNPNTQELEWVDVHKRVCIDEIGILSYLMNKKTSYLVKAVRKKHPEFDYLREREVIAVQPSDPSMPLPRNIECLSLPQLKAFIRANGYQINVKLFPSLQDLRNAVLNYQEGPDGYKEFESRWRRKHSITAGFSSLFDELNATESEV